MKNWLLALVKLLGIFALLIFSGNYQIFKRIEELFVLHGNVHCFFFITLWILCFSSLLVVAFLPNKLFRIIFSLLAFITTLISVVYVNTSNESIGYDNLYILVENINFAYDALQHFISEIISSLLVAIIVFVFILQPPENLNKYYKNMNMKIFLYFIVFLPFLLFFIIAWPRGGYGLKEMPVQFKIPVLLSIITFEKVNPDEINRNNINENVLVKKGEKINIILVIDESVRGDYLDINNNQGITPYLYSQKQRIINFGYATSGANCSAGSNQILRFGPNQNNFAQTFVTNPYIWQYAKKAGYRTIMIEGQVSKGHQNNRMKQKEKSYIDEFIYTHGKTNYAKDKNTAILIKKHLSLKSSQPIFIYAIKSGVHFPYDRLVPEAKKKYVSVASADKKTNMVNSYKNAINYITDSFFTYLIEDAEFKDTLIIYTSDHGQNLLDNGLSMTHCTIENPSPYEALVPLIMLTDNRMMQKTLKQASIINANKVSHFNIFPTILSIFGFNNNDVESIHGRSVFAKLPKQRKFVSGRLAVNRLLNDGKSQFNKRNQWNYLPNNFMISKDSN